jgi:hypothetical protein
VVAHICNPRTQETKTGGQEVPGQPGLYRETVTENKIPLSVEISHTLINRILSYITKVN